MKKIIFVTSNENKAREAANILGVVVKHISIELDEIQEMSLIKIVEYKAREAYRKLKKPVLVEDVGLYVKDWNGFPGPFIKWVQKTMGYRRFPRRISKKNRGAEWQVAYGFYDGKKFYSCVGKVAGSIAFSPKGPNGWGFDVLFIPRGHKKTFAQMGGSVKMQIGARRKALDTLKKLLRRSKRFG